MRKMIVMIIRRDHTEKIRIYKDVYDIGHMNDGTLNVFRISRTADGMPERFYFPLDKYKVCVTEVPLHEPRI